MSYSVHDKSFWLWLIPDEDSIHKINLIRSNIKIKNGTTDFPLHITLGPIDDLTPNLYSTIEEFSKELPLVNAEFICRINYGNYFNSIGLIPNDLTFFNNKLHSILSKIQYNFNINRDTHLSLAYTKLEKNFNNIVYFNSIKFSKLAIAFVDEKNQFWKIL